MYLQARRDGIAAKRFLTVISGSPRSLNGVEWLLEAGSLDFPDLRKLTWQYLLMNYFCANPQLRQIDASMSWVSSHGIATRPTSTAPGGF